MATKSAGRVSIRVIPDATKFRNDLKLLLKRVEQSFSANLKVDADVRPLKASVNHAVKELAHTKIPLDLELDKSARRIAGIQVDIASRRRRVPLDLTVAKASLAKSGAAIGTFLATFSGARLAGDFVSNLGERLQNLDRALPKIGAVSLGIASLGAVGLNAVNGLGAMVVQLGQLAPLAALLPGLLAGAATGATTLILALKDAPARLGSTLTAYKSLQGVVSNDFWSKAQAPIRELLSSQLPGLKSGFSALATQMGSSIGGIADMLKNTLGGGVLESIFADMAAGTAAAAPGLASFANAFVSLLDTGASYLPRLGAWISDIGTRFSDWLAGVTASGALNQMIDTALVLLGNLGSSVVSIGQILAGVFGATGGDAIGGLATGLASIATIVNSPAFQTALTTIFTGAAEGAGYLATALGPVGEMFAALAPTIATILSTSGAALSDFFTELAGALSSPAFASGLQALFGGLQEALYGIQPALPAIAAAFGSLAGFAGNLAAVLGPVLGAVLSALGPILTQVLDAVTPLLPVLGGALISIIQQLAPLFEPLISSILPPLVQLISELIPTMMPLIGVVAQIAPLFGQLVSAILPPLVALFAALIPALMPLVEAILPILQMILPVVAQAFGALIPVITPILTLVAQLAQLIAPLIQVALQPLMLLLPLIAQNFQMLQPVIEIVSTVIGAIAQIISTVLMGALKAFGQILRGDFKGAMDTMGQAFESVASIAKSAFNSITGVVEGVINAVIDGVNGVIGGINDIAAGVKSATGGAIDIKIGKLPKVKLPRLAVGADILPTFGGTAVVLGEGGRAETVTDLGRTNRLIELANAISERALAGTGAASAGFPESVALLDADGSLLGRMRTIVDDAATARTTQLRAGRQRKAG